MDRMGKLLLFGGMLGVGVGAALYARASTPSRLTPLPQGGSSTAPVGNAAGASQAQIACVQTKLNQLGYAAGTVDGFYGSSTTAAIARFQTANGLPPTGNLDGATRGSALSSCFATIETSAAPASSSASEPSPPPTESPWFGDIPAPANGAAPPSSDVAAPPSGAQSPSASSLGELSGSYIPLYIPGYGQLLNPCYEGLVIGEQQASWNRWVNSEAGAMQLYQAANILRAANPPCDREADYIEETARWRFTTKA